MLIKLGAPAAGNSVNIGLTDKAITSADLPAQVVQYTARAQESIILEVSSGISEYSASLTRRCRNPEVGCDACCA